jgi:DNA-binding SARP family transcriptional activator
MGHLSLSFLGGFRVTLDAEPVTAFGADKARALLAFLAIESSRPHRRATLGAMFWPDLAEKKAAHNLSQTLLRLRQALRETRDPARPSFLVMSTQDVQFDDCSDCELDVSRFRELLSMCNRHNHVDATSCGVCQQWLLQAAELYQGDLLAGLFVPDSVAFEEWRLVQQEELHGGALQALVRLAAYHEQRGEYERVQDFARRQIALEPWREEAHAQLMRALAQSGQIAAALRQYEICRRTLAEELDLKPSADVTHLYEQIRLRETSQPASMNSPVEEAIWLSTHGERRQVTTLVCSPGVQADSEEMQEQIESCGRHCEGIFNRFGGRRALRQGGACLVYFGYPQAHEDAARRAVHSGLAMAAVVEGDESVRIGVHTGVMLVGESRGPRWQERDLVGRAVEIARDCQRLANPGEVVITEETRCLVRDSFDLEPLKSQIAGVTGQTAQVYRVRGESDAPSRLDWLARLQRLTVFTGREEELRRLEACLVGARQGKGQIVLVNGEPGIGKSRLLWELKERTPIIGASTAGVLDSGSAVLWLASRCLPYFQDTSLYPVIGLLEQLCGFQTGDSPDIRREKLTGTLAWYGLNRPAGVWLLSLLLGLPTSAPAPETITQAQREQMREILVALLQKRAAEQALVLVIEDLHWSDPSTVDWLGRSIAPLAAVPCLVLLTARPGFQPAWLSDESSRSSFLLLPLSPLRTDDAERMVVDLAGESTLDEEGRRHIVAQTDGIPLFVEELTKTLLERSAFRGQGNRAMDIPATLLDSLAARLDHLGAAKETAQWAAILGREFGYSILQACVPYDEQRLQGDLARLIEAELVSLIDATKPARYAFKHVLMQETAYASMLKRTRQDYHGQVAETLETRFPQVAERRPEILAQHYANAGEQTKAVDFWLRAGERATAQGATSEARTFFTRALEGIELEDRERRWQALLGREVVLNFREERVAQKEDIEALLETAEALNDDTRRAQAYLRQTRYASPMEDHQLKLHASEAAIAAAVRAGNRALEVQALAMKAQALIRLGERDAACQPGEETLAKLPEIADEVAQAHILADLAVYYGNAGDLSRSLLLFRRGTEMARRIGDRYSQSRCNLNIGYLYVEFGCYAEARTAYEEGLALAEATGDRHSQASFMFDLSYVFWCTGDLDRALAMGERVLLDLRATRSRPLGLAICLAYLGMMLEDVGDPAAAATYLAEARTLYANAGVTGYRMEVQAAEARCMLALRRREEAQRLAVEAWAYLRAHGSAGMDFPSRTFVCLADVFGAIEMPGVSVRQVLEAGYEDLIQRAEKISDADWRRSFLEKAVENRAIIERWQRLRQGS